MKSSIRERLLSGLALSLAAILLGSSASAQPQSDVQPEGWPPEIVPLEIFWNRDFLWPQTPFPLLSEDGQEVVVLHGGLYFDGDRSIGLDVFDVPAAQARDRHLLQHRDEDFSAGLANGRFLLERVTAVNRYLMTKTYESMQPFFQIEIDPAPGGWPVACYPHARCEFHSQAPGDSARLPAQVRVEQRSVRFDFQTGVLNVGSIGTSESGSLQNDLVLHWPITERRPAQADSRHNCRVQAAPREAWIGGSPRSDGRRVLLLRIGFLAEELACLQPDEWRVELLSE